MVTRTHHSVVSYVCILSCYLLLAVTRADDRLYTKLVNTYGVICVLVVAFIISVLDKYSRAAATCFRHSLPHYNTHL
jgi:hypothetical protein